ncbi:MAG: hypothetical protein RMJ52_17120, partial [Gemmataceae bacterium]|nr:hypothetical protein [Gemmataceae bacterium]
ANPPPPASTWPGHGGLDTPNNAAWGGAGAGGRRPVPGPTARRISRPAWDQGRGHGDDRYERRTAKA